MAEILNGLRWLVTWEGPPVPGGTFPRILCDSLPGAQAVVNEQLAEGSAEVAIEDRRTGERREYAAPIGEDEFAVECDDAGCTCGG